jgi:hypothetical protein
VGAAHAISNLNQWWKASGVQLNRRIDAADTFVDHAVMDEGTVSDLGMLAV